MYKMMMLHILYAMWNNTFSNKDNSVLNANNMYLLTFNYVFGEFDGISMFYVPKY